MVWYNGHYKRLSRVRRGFDSLYHRHYGLIAQLGEHLPCKQEVVGSIPTGSTIKLNIKKLQRLERSARAYRGILQKYLLNVRRVTLYTITMHNK